MKRIAMFGHKRIPSREGGIEVVVEELASRMVAKGYKVLCYNRKGHHVAGSQFDCEQKDKYKGIIIKSVWTVEKKGLAAITSSWAAAVRAAGSKAQIVHIHAEGPAFMCWLPKLFGKKVIVTVHGLDWQRDKWGKLARLYIKAGEKIAVKTADEIIVLSHGVQNYFEHEYHRKTVFIPNGVNRPQTQIADTITKKWGLIKNSYVLFVGRLVPEKGIEYLIRAWENVKTDKKLVIAGGSSDSDVFEHKLKQLSSDRIIFTGFQQGIILEELYSNAYIYVLPSDLEGMPLSLLEAMSYGNCCVVSDIPECAEVVEDKAITFSKGNIEELRSTIQKLLDNPELVREYKKMASDYICRKYDWDEVVNKTLELYG